jgi:hypothetical protein
MNLISCAVMEQNSSNIGKTIIKLLISLICFTLFNCASNKHIYLKSSPEVLQMELDSLRTDKSVVLYTIFDDTIKGKIEKISVDSLTLLKKDGVNIINFRIPEITKIRYTSRSRGFFEGMGIGALSGIVIGFAIGYSGGKNCVERPGHVCGEPGEGAVLGGYLLGILGSVIGMPIGAAVGHRTYYNFHNRGVNW